VTHQEDRDQAWLDSIADAEHGRLLARTPAAEPEQIDDEPLPTHQDEYRCEWCYAYLPDDGLCRCPGSLKDLEQERLEQRYELEKER
jgi:hypothetical protein